MDHIRRSAWFTVGSFQSWIHDSDWGSLWYRPVHHLDLDKDRWIPFPESLLFTFDCERWLSHLFFLVKSFWGFSPEFLLMCPCIQNATEWPAVSPYVFYEMLCMAMTESSLMHWSADHIFPKLYLDGPWLMVIRDQCDLLAWLVMNGMQFSFEAQGFICSSSAYKLHISLLLSFSGSSDTKFFFMVSSR